jgi:tRNA/tmRNA/rRNA uracil-C5-methylase (TrmA/RlmC/RlmD family)
VFRSPVSHYRMRAEFRLWHDGDDLYHIMFDQQTKSRIRVDTFPAASELINQLMAAVIEGVRDNPVLRHKLFQVDYLTTLSNQAVISLLYHKSSTMNGVSRRALARCAAGAKSECAPDWPPPKPKSSWIKTISMNACRLAGVK